MTTKEEIKQKQMDNLTTTEKLVTSLIDYGYLQRLAVWLVSLAPPFQITRIASGL